MLLRNRGSATTTALMASRRLLNNPSPFILVQNPPSSSSSFSFSSPSHLSFIAGLSFTSNANANASIHTHTPAILETPKVTRKNSATLMELIRKLEKIGFDACSSKPGQHTYLLCPRCGGGDSSEMSLSLFIAVDGGEAVWNCFLDECGWRGSMRAIADAKSSYGMMNKPNVKEKREITEESLGLEPLSDAVLGYFALRMISGETLKRNSVMQRGQENQVVCVQ